MGYKEGRSKCFASEQISHALDLLNNYSYNKVERITKISESTLTRENEKEKL